MGDDAASSLGRKAQLLFVSQGLGAVLGYFALLAIGRYFEPAAYGSFVFATGAMGAVAILSSLGFGEAHVHFVARGIPLDRALGIYARVRFGLVALLVLLVVAVGTLGGDWLRERLVDATTFPVLATALGIQALSSLRYVAFDSWLGREQVNRTELVKTLDSLLTLAGLAVVGLAAASAEGRWTPAGPLAPALADLLGIPAGGLDVPQAALALALVYLTAKVGSTLPVLAWTLRERVPLAGWDATLARQYAAYAFPIALAAGATLVLAYTDVVLIGYFLDAEAVGQYGAAQRLANLVLVAAIAVATPLLPRFASLWQQGRRDEAAKTLRSTERGLHLVALPLAAALVALPRPILHIAVGDAYLGAADSLRWLGVGALAASALILGRSKVMGIGQARVAMVAGFLAAGLNVAFNVALIPDWGADLGAPGAAIGSLLATLVAATYLRQRLRRDHAVPAWDPVLVRLGLAAAALAAAWAGALRWLGPAAFDRVWELGAWGAAGLLLFWGAAWAMGCVEASLLVTVRRLLNPRHFLDEVRGR